MTMFITILFNTYLVFSGINELEEVIKILCPFNIPWNWVNTSMVNPWLTQFAFRFYSMMLTSTILGLITQRYYINLYFSVFIAL